ncbi:hypothetical protein F9C07_2746 [Aspergillus flavus]|uniref:Uncharacterized protein n=1 Tax=Aspergillus flavus (strain ATCC 200026 / FGSC A1120 / IAM 13836 / NRRL 3357 / JCM 12722 / SRRC 167) TaxID=332952 RepID=A0A7G5JWG9_ASPFN|nr:uncharacterized protein G4B84_003179 [Aspergillus flavus NRRL3357]KAF7619618.1 hypothetical protein AFLA_001243 [Aspergillus flavus NRRL3357]QMW27890.1 hypothetical protein G4B84_003179 [Aspergillus flavus NRRL3357]QMW39961.1 hypothetical protein G4B11_003241 [Aspergillus flavus]QRD82329.1 hypothetical protein F9C07_2746 [Aspergillus flavus]
MFEDFSFSSPSSTKPPRLAFDGDDNLMVDCDSSLISPLSSRCPSPRSTATHRIPRSLPRSRSSYFRSAQPPTSVPLSAYDDHQKRLSISTLTRKLHEHTIKTSDNETQFGRPATPTSPQSLDTSDRFPGYFLTPPDTDHDDEGSLDSPSLTSGSLSPQPQSPFLSPTSVPCDLFPQTADMDPLSHSQDSWNIRAQRQNISRLQCNHSELEAIRRALISDDEKLTTTFDPDACHPSSIPPQKSPRRRAATLQRSRFRPQLGPSLLDPPSSDSKGRRMSSVIPVQTTRIEKNYHSSSRDLRKKSEQGLRRKSLVSAALASMVEKEC